MSRRFEDKKICLTAAGLISKTLARAFIEQGANIFLTAPKLETASAIAAELGPAAVPLQLDMNARDSIATCLEYLLAEGGVDVFVNHASDIEVVDFLDISEAGFDEAFAVNVRGVTFTLLAVARQMVALGKHGAIINRLGQLGSTSYERGAPFTAVFNATNAALVSMTRSAAIALAPHGIRVNAIAPGPIDMPIWRDLEEAYARVKNRERGREMDEMSASAPMKRFGAPADLIGTTLFLASDDSEFVTGQAINVDGGYSLV